MRCNRRNRWKPGACSLGQESARPRCGGGWGWLFIVGVFFVPWSWACERRADNRPARGQKFHLERRTAEAEATFAKLKEQWLEDVKAGKLTAEAFDEAVKQAEKTLKGRGEDAEALAEEASIRAQEAAELATARAKEAAEHGTALAKEAAERGAALAREAAERASAEGKRLAEEATRRGAELAQRAAPPAVRAPSTRKENGRAVVVSGAKSAPIGATIPEWTIELEQGDEAGFSSDPARAKANVVKKAGQRVAEWIRERGPDTALSAFEPDWAYMKKENMFLSGPEAFEAEKSKGLNGDKIWSARATIRLAADTQRALVEAGRRSQEERRLEAAWSRQEIAAKGMGAVCAVLLALVAYFWLDDRTRGFYSKPLAIALIGGAVAVGVVIFRARGGNAW